MVAPTGSSSINPISKEELAKQIILTPGPPRAIAAIRSAHPHLKFEIPPNPKTALSKPIPLKRSSTGSDDKIKKAIFKAMQSCSSEKKIERGPAELFQAARRGFSKFTALKPWQWALKPSANEFRVISPLNLATSKLLYFNSILLATKPISINWKLYQNRWEISPETFESTQNSKIKKGTDRLTRCDIVVKEPLTPEAKTDFMEEARFRVSASGIPYVLKPDFLIQLAGAKTLLIAMPRFEETLLAYERTGQKPSFEQLLKLFEVLLTFHQAMHARSLIHGDIKPGNIGVIPHITIFDFGLVHDPNYVQRPPNRTCTIHYRPPEIVIGRKYGLDADIWSIGATLYEAFTATVFSPFTSDDEPAQSKHLDQIAKRIGPPPPGYVQEGKISGKYYENPSQASVKYPSPLALSPLIKALEDEFERRKNVCRENIPPKASSATIDLFSRILSYQNRPSPQEALQAVKNISKIWREANPSEANL